MPLWMPPTPRLTPPDASTILYYMFNESGPPLVNQGNAGSLNMTLVSGSAGTFRRAGVFDMCLGTAGASDYATANTSTGETAVKTWSLHGWANFYAYSGANFPDIFTKQYRGDGTWNAPFTSLAFQMTSAGDGTWQTVATIAGVAKAVTMGDPYKLQLGFWYHLAMTSDSNNAFVYLNGEQCGTFALGTNVGIDWGTHGRWIAMGNPALAVTKAKGRINNWRFESVTRSQSYFQTYYKNGISWFGQ